MSETFFEWMKEHHHDQKFTAEQIEIMRDMWGEASQRGREYGFKQGDRMCKMNIPSIVADLISKHFQEEAKRDGTYL